MEEGILHKVPKSVKVLVIRSLLLPILLWRNNNLHSGIDRMRDDGVAVITPICQQNFRVNAFDQVDSLRTIRSGTFCNKRSDRHTIRIHGQMYLGVEPPFVRAIS